MSAGRNGRHRRRPFLPADSSIRRLTPPDESTVASRGTFAKLTVRSNGIVSVCRACSGNPSGKSASAASTSSSSSVACTVLNVKPNGLGFVTFVQMRTVAAPAARPGLNRREPYLARPIGCLLETRGLNQRAQPFEGRAAGQREGEEIGGEEGAELACAPHLQVSNLTG